MDASLVEECIDKRSEPNLASQSTRPLNELRSIEQGATDDKQESGKCHHFSIRGYVAEVRKSNRKICWPFHIIDNHYNLEEHANLLPPITVTQYRWWDCQNCVRKTNATEAAIENGAIMNSHNDEIKRLKTDRTSFHGNSIVGSHADAPNLLSGFQVASGDSILDGRPVEADSSFYLNGVHCHPSICFSEIDKEFGILDTTKEGTRKYEGSLSRLEKDQNLITETPTCGLIKDGPFRKGERDTTQIRKIMFGSKAHKPSCMKSDFGTANTSETVIQGTNSHDTMVVEPKRTRLISEFAGTEMDTGILTSMVDSVSEFTHNDNQGPSKQSVAEMREPDHKKFKDYGILQGVDTSIQKDDFVTAVTVHECDFGTMGFDESNLETSKCNGDSIENKDDNQHCASTSNGNSVRRKARKVRTLNDIIKSEALGLSGKVHLSYGDERIPTKNNTNAKPSASKEEKLPENCKSNVALQEKERKLFGNKKRNGSLEGEDEGPSLMHWLKRMPKKVKTHKGDAEPKHVDNAVVNSKSVADTSTGKILHSSLKECESVKGIDRKIVGSMEQNKTAQVEVVHHCVMPQQGALPGNNRSNIEDATAKKVNARKVHPISERDNCNLYPDHELHDSPYKNAIMSKKKNNTHQVTDEGSSPKNRLKDSFSTFKYETVGCYQGSQKVSKKRSVRRTNRTGEQDAVDGIPIAILELLQNNYQKKHQLNSERSTANIAHSSEINNNMKDGKMLDLTESNGNEAPSSQYKNQSMLNSQSNNTGCGICATGKSTENSNQEFKAQSSRGSGKRKRQINMNQGEECCTTNGSPALDARLYIEKPRNGIQLPPTGSIRNSSPQNHSWQRNMLQNVESCHEAQTISSQNPCSYAHHGAIGINNSLKIHPDIYHSSMLSQATLQERNPNKVTHETGGPKSIDPTVTHLHKIKQKVDAKANRKMVSAGKVCLGVGKECHPKTMRPLDLYTNDTISAMHLLRLMDPAVCSTVPVCASLDRNQKEFLKKSKHGPNHHHREFQGLEAGVRTNEASKHSGTLEHLDQIHNQGNSSKIISPVPKIGAFGSLLQKGISTGSNKFRTPFAFKGGHPSEVASSRNCRKEKTKSSHSATQTRVSKVSPVSRDGNSQDRLLSVLNPTTHSEHSQQSKHVIQPWFKNMDEVYFPLKSSCQTELCVVNRNPADFTIPDEDNVYMIEHKILKSKDVSPLGNGQFALYPDAQRQRIMKLSALKGILRS